MQGKFHFIDGTAVHIGPQVPDITQDVHIGKRLAGIEKNRIGIAERFLQFPELFFYFFRVVYVERSSVIFSNGDEFGRGQGCRHDREDKKKVWEYGSVGVWECIARRIPPWRVVGD